MLEVLSNFICSFIMSITGFYIIKSITRTNEKKLNVRNLILLIILTIFQVILHKVQYNIENTLIAFLINMLLYKIIFKITYEEALISCGIYTIILFSSDVIVTMIIRTVYTVDQIRTISIISILTNIAVGTLCNIIIEIEPIKNKLRKFYNTSKNKKQIIHLIFIFLLIICFVYLGYNVTTAKTHGISYIINLTIMVILVLIAYIFIQSRNSYNQLSDEYDTLFSYVQNFEEWIEKEQLNRHEYKNQLAVLRSLTKEKEMINKIDEILEDNINIKGDVVHKLKELPKGGIKGLMYYKVVLAQKQKLNLEIDISLPKKANLRKLSENQIRTICKLIGIYLDNAIEAAIDTKKKTISLEVYEIKEQSKIVISNTFEKSKDFDKRNDKGFTTKGKGRGNGLYFANSLIEKNKWISSTQEIIDDYYIQTITIKN